MNSVDDKRRAQRNAHPRHTDLNDLARYEAARTRNMRATSYGTIETSPQPSGSPAAPTPSQASSPSVDHAAIEVKLRGWDLCIVHAQLATTLRSSRDAGAEPLERLIDRYTPVLDR